MMDISDAMRGPIVAGERSPNERERSRREDSIDDDRRTWKNLKRKADDEYITYSKKRRKQLKPIKIATNLDDMVKVPKQIIGLNNDLDNVNDMTHAVPNDNSSKSQISPNLKLNDVHLCRFPLDNKSNVNSSIDRDTEKPEIPDVNVPNLDAGPNFVTNPNLIFPFTFQPMKNPHPWSEANLKIFNQEAYCELCKKEFCNKYFLKTHKANKHGIYVDFPGAGSSVTASSSGKLKAEPRAPENGKNTDADCERAFCELCNKRFCNKYFVRRHKSKSHGLPDEENHSGLPCHESDASSIQSTTINLTNTARKSVSIVTTCDSVAVVAKDNDFDGDGPTVQNSPLNLIVKDGAGSEEEEDGNEDGENNADECSGENIEKLETMLLRLNPSESDGRTCKVCREVTDGSADHRCGHERKCDYLSDANDSSNESKSEFPLPKSESHDLLYMGRLDHMKQTKPTSSYCEICNKELCNKYFMRTHMQRMHGIEIEHGTQIGGVVCNICNKELCSKYFLRVHKQNTHGIASPNSVVGPSTSGNTPGSRPDGKPPRPESRFPSSFTQVCSICNKRFRSPKWLQAHFLSDHRDERQLPSDNQEDDHNCREDDSVLKIPKKGPVPEQVDTPEALDVISKLFWENDSPSKSYNCSQCPFTTSVLAFLFVHERSHYVLSQDHPSEADKSPLSLHSLLHDRSLWQHKITQQISDCLDLSSGKSKYVSFEQNGS